MRKRVKIAIGTMCTAVIPIIVVAMTATIVVWERHGHDTYYDPDQQPQGLSLEIFYSILVPNKFIVGVGQDMVSADQGMDTGYINITHAVSGQEWSLSYALGPVEFVEIKWATAVWDLPEGVYDVEVHNYNTVEGERYDVDYTVLSAGLFRDLSDRNAFVDDSSDLMAMYYAICISMVIVLAGVILIARKPKEQEFSDYNDKKAVAKKMRKGWE